MISCRYVGGDCSDVGGREFDAVGQRATFSEESFREVLLRLAPFIPDADFDKVEFTEHELSTYGPSGKRVDPPQSFCDKLALAQEICRDLRERMLGGGGEVLAEVADQEVEQLA